ncbi:4Fe-4S binding protein [Desulfotruncus alcoholivorax]|uniref:4Fe-4S binding protein n=1 Tax=Desulfotruncus alcoholivorax TaxID=265477 RepID=UPI00040DF093|nr:4Fe-4S binding protein [Desulfotruncus alcoholivorax]
MQLLNDFMKIIQAPDFVQPYIHFFASEKEMQLVVLLNEQKLTGQEIATLLQEPDEDVKFLLEQAYRRHIINRTVEDGVAVYSAGDFYNRLDSHSLYGNYYVIPKKIRSKLDEWCFEEYLKRHEYFSKVINSEPEYDNCHNEWVLLLNEVEEMIDASTKIKVVPCNCKMMADNCDYSREICIFFDDKIDDRTIGRELTREEAKDLVRKLDKEGLMHTGGPHNWREKGPGVVCNCCACCCYPFRAAIKLGTKGKWPKSRYVAKYDAEKCRSCGLCVKRCHFNAFYFDGSNIAFNNELCWGCGLCANTCPSKAITLEELAGTK